MSHKYKEGDVIFWEDLNTEYVIDSILNDNSYVIFMSKHLTSTDWNKYCFPVKKECLEASSRLISRFGGVSTANAVKSTVTEGDDVKEEPKKTYEAVRDDYTAKLLADWVKSTGKYIK